MSVVVVVVVVVLVLVLVVVVVLAVVFAMPVFPLPVAKNPSTDAKNSTSRRGKLLLFVHRRKKPP